MSERHADLYTYIPSIDLIALCVSFVVACVVCCASELGLAVRTLSIEDTRHSAVHSFARGAQLMMVYLSKVGTSRRKMQISHRRCETQTVLDACAEGSTAQLTTMSSFTLLPLHHSGRLVVDAIKLEQRAPTKAHVALKCTKFVEV